MALFEYGDVTVSQALKMVPTMPFDEKAQRRLRATIRRWAKSVRDAGYDVTDE